MKTLIAILVFASLAAAQNPIPTAQITWRDLCMVYATNPPYIYCPSAASTITISSRDGCGDGYCWHWKDGDIYLKAHGIIFAPHVKPPDATSVSAVVLKDHAVPICWMDKGGKMHLIRGTWKECAAVAVADIIAGR